MCNSKVRDMLLTFPQTHGTGTKVGDPIEVEGISYTFGQQPRGPTLIGGVKPNIGHTEAASGLASVIKAVLALEKRIIPPTRITGVVSPQLKLEERHLSIVTTPQAFANDELARISVNSFGFGGTNSQVVLEGHARAEYH